MTEHAPDAYPALKATFEEKKRQYFIKLGLTLKNELAVHAQSGLRELNPEGGKEWSNISEHCIVEASRVGVFADLLVLDEKMTHRLVRGAMLHDHYKRHEVEIMDAEGLTG